MGKLRKAREGHIIGNEAPYGYNYVPLKKEKDKKIMGYYVINEEEARVVRMIFEWVANDGLTVRGVAKRLRDLGIKPRESKRGVWSTSTLSILLRRTAYIGETHYLKSYGIVPKNPLKNETYKKNKKTSRKIRPKDEWITIPMPELAIVEKDLFDKAQERLSMNKDLSRRNTKNEYLLAGKMYCICGSRRDGQGKLHGKHLYYRFIERIKRFPLPATCFEKGVNAKLADKLTWKMISEMFSSSELIKKQLSRWEAKNKRKKVDSLGDLGEFESKIKKLKGEEDRYNKAYGAGLFDIGQLKEYTTEIKENIQSLELQIAKIKENQNTSGILLPSNGEIKSFVSEVKEVINVRFLINSLETF